MRYQLIDKCLFVDAMDYDTRVRHPKELPFAHVLDQRKWPNTYLQLSDSAGYIARFIAMGVDTDLIPLILRSEYRPNMGKQVDSIDFAAEVQAVVNMLQPYLKEREHAREYYSSHPSKQFNEAQYVDQAGNPIKGYALDFSVNGFPIGCCKIPV